MNKKIISVKDRNRVGIDQLIVHINVKSWKLKIKDFKTVFDHKLRRTYLVINNEKRLYLNARKKLNSLTFDIELNGYKIMRSLIESWNIDCEGYESGFVGETNFIPSEIILAHQEVPWRTLWRRKLAEAIVEQLEHEKAILLKEIWAQSPQSEFYFDQYSIAKMEVSLDILSARGIELIDLNLVRSTLNAWTQDNSEKFFDKRVRGRSSVRLTDIDLINIGSDTEEGIKTLKGTTSKKSVVKLYTKQKGEKLTLNRFEFVIINGDVFRKEFGLSNMFTDERGLGVIFETAYNKWFLSLRKRFALEYSVDFALVTKVIAQMVIDLHPHNSADLIEELMLSKNTNSIGKININDGRWRKTKIREMAKALLLIKPDNSPKGRKYYCLNPDIYKEVARKIKSGKL